MLQTGNSETTKQYLISHSLNAVKHNCLIKILVTGSLTGWRTKSHTILSSH